MRRSILGLVLIASLLAVGVGFSAVSASASEEQGTTCATNTGLAKLSPGVSEEAAIQNVVVKGTLGECSGSTGPTGKYVVHLKTTTAVTCASLAGEGAVAEGNEVIKWGKGSGNSKGPLTASGSLASGFALSGSITKGPFTGGTVSGSVSGTPVFTGKGEPCTKKNRLKQIEVAGTTPFAIS